jgi:outer membrane lipoprotein-sorting protein
MRTLALATALTLLALPAQAEKLSLATLSDYLNAISTAETDFTQINSDQTISTGRIFIQRPGRVRFEYAPPDDSLVLASAGNVAIFDGKSNADPEQYPLSRTPLNLILAADIDLSRARMVSDHTADDTTTRVVAQDPDHPEYGTIELVFSADPVALRQWVITDNSGQETTVILGELAKGGSFPASLFSITQEAQRRD